MVTLFICFKDKANHEWDIFLWENWRPVFLCLRQRNYKNNLNITSELVYEKRGSVLLIFKTKAEQEVWTGSLQQRIKISIHFLRNYSCLRNLDIITCRVKGFLSKRVGNIKLTYSVLIILLGLRWYNSGFQFVVWRRDLKGE